MNKLSFLLLSAALAWTLGLECAKAQITTYRPIATAVPSLRISPDARSAALGEQGVATSADVYAQYWSSAKYTFAEQPSGVAISYTPWLRHVTEDMSLIQLVGYHNLNKKHSLGASVRYFSIGKLNEWNEFGQTIGEGNPYELSADLSYSYRLIDQLAIGATVRYIHTDYAQRGASDRQARLAFDLSLYGEQALPVLNNDKLHYGLALRNLGDKLSYDGNNTYAFLPTTLSLGVGLSHSFDELNGLALSFQMDKILVPTFPNADDYKSGKELTQARKLYYRRSLLSSMRASFTPEGGFSEVLKDIRWGVGLEYNYKRMLFARAGYSYQHPDRGNLRAFTLGAGMHWRALMLDLSYQISPTSNPAQDGTFRLSLGLDISSLRLLHGLQKDK